MKTSFSTLTDALNIASEYDELVRVNNVRRLSTIAKTYKNILAGRCSPVNKLSDELRATFEQLAHDYNEAVNYEISS